MQRSVSVGRGISVLIFVVELKVVFHVEEIRVIDIPQRLLYLRDIDISCNQLLKNSAVRDVVLKQSTDDFSVFVYDLFVNSALSF